nr:ferredoxin-thioredoxin reductase variable chain [Richelia intracellularis]
MTVDTVLGEQILDASLAMKIGDRVRVKNSVVVYHHPEHRGESFDIKNSEGEVIKIATQWQGRPVSANLPIVVKFSRKFKAHLRENELEILSYSRNAQSLH